ncbi:hypothetical protein DFS33DRAFT_1379355 [Desarmillaria ectypa]|nr:hypothetical protein DFS33DRAFT_1379355 [Desarmillaria ectypa]
MLSASDTRHKAAKWIISSVFPFTEQFVVVSLVQIGAHIYVVQNTISNLGIFIPVGYKEWKECIIMMNQEQQHQQVMDSTHSIYPIDKKSNNDNNAETSKGSSGITSGTLEKKTSMGSTYSGQGLPMDIDALKVEGKCFCCKKNGHCSKDCLEQSWNKKKKEVRASMTKPAMDSKIKEVKDTAGK